MAILTLEEFTQRRTGDREPLLDLYWYCLQMPFGGDLDYVETASIPIPSINANSIFEAAAFRKFPGFMEIGELDITFYEDVRCRTRQWLNYWRNRIRNEDTGAYYLPSHYKRDWRFALTDGTSRSTPILTAYLVDTWPANSSPLELSNNAGQPIKVQQSFCVDRVYFE